ncbi:uncharacterized protein [Leuresthes tenuis]|uniref:uncharacterized protein isoform X4 n=1 Tax=Leuresthes tenuis TaxID=355514 RepID=UPI003B508D20
MGRKCAYPECKSTEGLHVLPSNREMALRWLHAMGRFDMPSTPLYVCNLHFTTECFSNPGEVKAGFMKLLLLNPDAVPIPTEVVKQECRVNANCQVSPIIRHVASQTDPPDFDFPKTRSVGTQLSMKTLQNHFRSTGTQVKVTSRDHGMCTVTLPLNSPMLFLQPTLVKRPSKRPRLNLAEDEEEGPSECSTSTMVHKAEDST